MFMGTGRGLTSSSFVYITVLFPGLLWYASRYLPADCGRPERLHFVALVPDEAKAGVISVVACIDNREVGSTCVACMDGNDGDFIAPAGIVMHQWLTFNSSWVCVVFNKNSWLE